MQTAKRLLVDKSSKVSCDEVSVTGSNYSSSNTGRTHLFSPESQSPLYISPESQTVHHPFAESFMDFQGSCNINHVRKILNRMLWNPQNEYVDISTKDGLFSKLARESYRSYASSEQVGFDARSSYVNRFPRFTPGSAADRAMRSRPHSPVNEALRSRPQNHAKGALTSQPQSPVNGAVNEVRLPVHR